MSNIFLLKSFFFYWLKSLPFESQLLEIWCYFNLLLERILVGIGKNYWEPILWWLLNDFGLDNLMFYFLFFGEELFKLFRLLLDENETNFYLNLCLSLCFFKVWSIFLRRISFFFSISFYYFNFNLFIYSFCFTNIFILLRESCLCSLLHCLTFIKAYFLKFLTLLWLIFSI